MGPGEASGWYWTEKHGASRQLDTLGGAVVEVHMRQANAAKALVHHDRRDSAAHPDAQISIGRMLGLAAGKLGDKLAQAGEQQAKAMVLRGDLHTAAYGFITGWLPPR